MDDRSTQLNKLMEEVLKSSKYRNICIDFIRNIGLRELSKRRNLKGAVKATKNKLHQVAGAYWKCKINYAEFLRRFEAVDKLDKEDRLRNICLEVMKCHSSTNERLKTIDGFYSRIFSALPPIRSIMDIGCGLNPLAIPWMRLDENVKYYAYDIYTDLIEFLYSFLNIINVSGCAEARDIITSPPDMNVDLAFILKSIPCLEQVDKSAGERILENTNANYLITSFPVQSLGGKNKNMVENYVNRFRELTKKGNWQIQRLDFENELVFLVEK